MPVQINTDTTGLSNYVQTTNLDGTDYLLEFRFNFRENCWYVQITLASDLTVLCQGIKIVSNFPLLQKYSDDRLPPGELVSLAIAGSDDSPAGLMELAIGARCELWYFFKSDMAPGFEGWRSDGA